MLSRLKELRSKFDAQGFKAKLVVADYLLPRATRIGMDDRNRVTTDAEMVDFLSAVAVPEQIDATGDITVEIREYVLAKGAAEPVVAPKASVAVDETYIVLRETTAQTADEPVVGGASEQDAPAKSVDGVAGDVDATPGETGDTGEGADVPDQPATDPVAEPAPTRRGRKAGA